MNCQKKSMPSICGLGAEEAGLSTNKAKTRGVTCRKLARLYFTLPVFDLCARFRTKGRIEIHKPRNIAGNNPQIGFRKWDERP